ncbi:MAG: glycosyltransferase [Lachnospiraceae bacterium]
MDRKIPKCIFHIPNHIEKNGKSGSSIRPWSMIKAFDSLGYEVDCIMGYGVERKEKIREIREKIEKGVRYDFLYSENCNMPTLLTEKNHIPKYPLLDFSFLKFCKSKKIPIGLFYRDIYWKFPIYRDEVSKFKQLVTIPLYYYDLHQYKKFVDVLYLPSMRMKPVMGIDMNYKELPPGCIEPEEGFNGLQFVKSNNLEQRILHLFYVGGVGKLYDLEKLFEVVSKLQFVKLTVCCREAEWDEWKIHYKDKLNERISIIHKSGVELLPYYETADISMLFFDNQGYRSFAMPIKLFEYLSYGTPVIATNNTSAGDFVEQNDVGWSIDYNTEELTKLLESISFDSNVLKDKQQKIQSALKKNTWRARAQQVVDELL